jgi:hypothetical protein
MSNILEEVKKLLGKGAIELVPPGQEGQGFYSTFFIVDIRTIFNKFVVRTPDYGGLLTNIRRNPSSIIFNTQGSEVTGFHLSTKFCT